LYLDGGVLQGQRLIPSKWISQSWLAYSDGSTDPAIFTDGSYYGLQWWGGTFQIPDGVRFRIVPATESDFDAVNDAGITGTWASPDLAHQGLMPEVVPTTGQVVIYWLTFAPGKGQQMWLFASGQLHN